MINPKNNLTRPYPQEFLDIWEGCGHLDCLPGCRVGLHDGHCARIEKAFAEFQGAGISIPPSTITDEELKEDLRGLTEANPKD